MHATHAAALPRTAPHIHVPPSMSKPRDPATAAYGGYDYTFVVPVSDEYHCSICTKVFREPHLTECCGQNYCGSCISHWLLSHPTCPHCRGSKFTHIQDKKLERKVRELEVECIHGGDGCQWKGCLSELNRHLTSDSGCVYAKQECPNKCGAVLPRRELKDHVWAACRLRVVECEYCRWSCSYESLASEHIGDCLEYPVSCRNDCGRILKRRDMQTHYEGDCPNVKVECPFAEFGCRSEPIPRKVLGSHVASCQSQHVVGAMQQLRGEIGLLRAELRGLQEENKTLRNDLEKTQEDLAGAQRGVESMKVKGELTNKTLMTELDYFPSVRDPVETLALECIKTQLRSNSIYLTGCGSPATFRMTSFSEYKETGKVWYTPPFYLPHGYKVCLAVHLNGVGSGKGTHVSLYLHQVAGEHDHNLKWPFLFTDDLEVRLMCQAGTSETGNRHTVKPSSSPSAHRKNTTLAISDHQGEIHPRTRSIPNRFSPLFNKRKSQTSTLPDHQPTVVSEECQYMRLSSYLHRVTDNVSIGPSCGKLELFCLQKVVDDVVYRDSIVFQCQLHSSSDVMLETLTHMGYTIT